MNGRFSVPLRVAAVTATAAVVSAMTTFPAAAADGDVQVVNTETVQVYTSPTGEVETKRIYEQLALTGTGSVDLANPISTDGLRNLDGFGGFDTEDGNQITKMSVDGEEHLRSVSDYTGKLPLDVTVEHYLDGTRVEPGDVVGEDGSLEVKYIVKNVTGVEQEVSFPDGKGGEITKTVNVPIPMVGSLTTLVPESFTEVKSEAANMAGDGKGNTKLSFTMTLFPPIGSDTAEFGYTANVTDGVVPRTSISALPVNPLESPTFASAADSYQGGADTGIELTDGATEIDANLLKLRDGAGDLLAGLIKLRDGSQQLEAGLAGEASPGAARLAEGADQLNSGLGQINSGSELLADKLGEAAVGGSKLRDGAGRLADGATKASAGSKLLADGTASAADGGHDLADGLGRLNAGTGELSTGLLAAEAGSRALAQGFNSSTGDPDFVTGSQKLVEGLKLISGGLKQLAGVEGLPKAKAGATALHDGVDQLILRVGSVDEPETLIGGLVALRTAIDTQLIPGATKLKEGGAALATQLPAAKDGVDDVKDGLDLALAPDGDLDRLTGGLAAVKGTAGCLSDPECQGTVEALSQGVNGAGGTREKLAAASGGLGQVSEGLTAAVSGATALSDGAARLEGGLGLASAGAGELQTGAEKLRGALETQIKPGLQQLVDGLTDAVSGVTALSSGADEAVNGAQTLSEKLGIAGAGAGALADGLASASDGSGRLAAGTAKAAAGGDELSSGLGRLNAGAGELSAGLGALSDGAGQLRRGTFTLEDGLSKLSDGAGELNDGVGKAADGSTRIADGANKLADGLGDAADGSGKLAGGLEKAAAGAPKLEDGAQRLSDEGTKKLIEAGESTAQTYGELYATIAAGAERAQSEKMVFGAPEGAMGLAAYSYEIKGDDGEGGRNLARGLGGLAVLAAGAGAFALRRRMI